MSPPFLSSVKDKLRTHFDRRDFIDFIVTVSGVNKATVKRFRKRYMKIKDLIVTSKSEKFLTLNEYHAEQLFNYLNERFIVY